MVQPRERRTPIMFSEDELAAIDDWRFANRIATRADAVRRLCKIALLLDTEFEQAVDMASDGVEILSERSNDLSEVFRLVINRETFGTTFDRDQLWDIFSVAREQADEAEEGVRGLHTLLVTMFNAVAAIVEARSVKGGVRKSQEVIEKASAAIQQAEQRRLEREAEQEENRYIALISHSWTPEERAVYDAVPEEEKDNYLGQKIAALKAEEQADPAAFAKRFGIDTRKFWEKPEWLEYLKKREIERQKEDELNPTKM